MLRSILKKERDEKAIKKSVAWSEESLQQIKHYDPDEMCSMIEEKVEQKPEENREEDEISWLNLLVGAAGIGMFRLTRNASFYCNAIGVGSLMSIVILKTISSCMGVNTEIDHRSSCLNKFSGFPSRK